MKYFNSKGFTLIEMLVALSIIMVMIISITPLLVFSLKSIADAGEKSKAVLNSTGKVDVGIASGDASLESAIPVKFKTTSTAINVEGGVVTAGSISTFLADSETISITPFSANEGYAGQISVTVIGKRTHFKTGSTTLEIKDKNGYGIAYTNFAVNSPTQATFKLPNNLRNTQSPLDIKLTTLLSAQSSKNEAVRTTFKINMPSYVAVGAAGKIAVWDGLANWSDRSIAAPDNLNSVIWGNDRYLAAGDNGKIYLLREGSAWTAIDTGLAGRFNDAVFTRNNFIIAGDGGRILSSEDGLSWMLLNSSVSANLNAIAGNDAVLIAAGSNGTVVSSTDGQIWTVSNAGISNDLNDLIYDGSRFIAAGNNGCVIASPDGAGWIPFSSGIPNTVNLYGIAYNGSTYIAVGSGGSIYRSDGTGWTPVSGINNTVSFRKIICKDGKFLVTSSTQDLYVLNPDGTVNSRVNTGSAGLVSISGR